MTLQLSWWDVNLLTAPRYVTGISPRTTHPATFTVQGAAVIVHLCWSGPTAAEHSWQRVMPGRQLSKHCPVQRTESKQWDNGKCAQTAAFLCYQGGKAHTEETKKPLCTCISSIRAMETRWLASESFLTSCFMFMAQGWRHVCFAPMHLRNCLSQAASPPQDTSTLLQISHNSEVLKLLKVCRSWRHHFSLLSGNYDVNGLFCHDLVFA